MADEFDPDAYLKSLQPPAPAQAEPAFDPDAYLKSREPAPAPASKAYTGKVLPFSRDEGGSLKFDPRAGVLGGYLALPELAGDVYAGRRSVDVGDPKFVGDVVGGALTYGPKPAAGLTTTANTPSTSGLKNAGAEGLQGYRDSLALYPGDEYRQLIRDTARNLKNDGLTTTTGSASHSHKILEDELARVEKHPFVTSRDVDSLRNALGNAPKDEMRGGMAAREEVMKFIEAKNPGPGGQAVRDAVGNYRQGSRSEFLEDALKKQDDLAAAKNSKPTAEQIRTNIAKLIHNKEVDKWSPEDTVGLNAALKSTAPQRAAQTIGKAMPSVSQVGQGSLIYGGGTGAALTATGLVSAPVAAAIGAGVTGAGVGAGYAARSYANRGARAAADEASEAVRRNSPLFRSGAPQLSSAPSSRDNIARTIVAPQVRQAPVAPAPAWQQLPEGGFVRKLPDGTLEELS